MKIITTNATKADQVRLEVAFENRYEVSWNNQIERYGYGMRNMDEVLTHIRFCTLYGYNPPIFTIGKDEEEQNT